MGRKVFIIGIGAGDPDFVTVQAVKTMNRVDVFFIPDKGSEKADLAQLRLAVIERHVAGRAFRIVTYSPPARRAAGGDYEGAVDDWHAQLAAAHGRLIRDELGETGTGAFLVWGDPTLYDSTIRVLETVRRAGKVAFDYEVIAGISAVQALAARHRVALNAIGQSILTTTGRRLLAEGFPDNAGSVAVMLDAGQSWKDADGDLDVYWGAYAGMADEILVSGKLRDVADEIGRIRAEARRRKGWIMDTTLLKRPARDAE